VKNIDVDICLNKIPPHDIEAERAILGGVMMDNNSLADVLEILEADGSDFYQTGHRILFQTILSLIDKGTPADSITICSALDGSGNLEKVGGMVGISEIQDGAMSSANIKHYAKIVKGTAVKRRIIAETVRLIEAAYTPSIPTEEILSEAQKTILSLSLAKDRNTVQTAYDMAKHVFAMIEARHQAGGTIQGLPTGFTQLDHLAGGLQSGNLVIIAARPGMGKTAFAVNIGARLALEGHPLLIFSLEMPSEDIMTRILSVRTGLDSRLLSRGIVRNDQWKALADATQKISESPLFIDDKASITPAEIRAKARRMKAEHKIELVIVDYLQLMRVPGRHDTREQQVAEISRTLKEIARELEIPVIWLC